MRALAETETDTPAALGQIMGISIGSDLERAPERLDPLRDPGGRGRHNDAEKEDGERAYWKLKETEYSWIIAWADEQGKITRIRAMLRPDQLKPFSEIGDVGTAAVNESNRIVWNLTTADGWPIRVIAQGPGQHATTIYIGSLREQTGVQ